MSHENIFREARDLARWCLNPDLRERLRDITDECRNVFDRFHVSASTEDFRELVGLFTKMSLIMDCARPWVSSPHAVRADVDHGAKQAP